VCTGYTVGKQSEQPRLVELDVRDVGAEDEEEADDGATDGVGLGVSEQCVEFESKL
jgi:hypothetical protein